MGINGLLPALKPITKQVHISKYKGQRVAVDGYSWLHKGAYTCARELCEGVWTDKYVKYFLSRIQLLRSNGVEPIAVFDGGRLPIKGEEEQSRHRARAEARERAAAHLASGNIAAAVECYQRCVNITPAMAKCVIEALKADGVHFIVAPYEADAQMAYLAKRGDVHAVITEDSDLVAYACPRVLYKLDRAGSGEELCLEDLPNCPGLPLSSFTSDQFLQLCVMAGCDFLQQLPGIGLKKAHGVLRKYRCFTKVVKMLRFNGTRVPADYEVRFQLALWAFRHCRVYCPDSLGLVHLQPLPQGGLGSADVDVPQALLHLEEQQQSVLLEFLGPHLDQDVAKGIAQGHLDPDTHKPFDLAKLYSGCPNPPPHVADLMGPVPHLLSLRGSAAQASAIQQGSGSAAGAVGGAASGGCRPRVGLSKKHSGRGKVQGSGAGGHSSGSSRKSGGSAAAAGCGNGKRKSTLGIARYFCVTAAAKGKENVDTTQEAAAGGTAAAAYSSFSQRPAAVAEGTQLAGSSVAAAAAPGAGAGASATPCLQDSITAALETLQQEQQQRQQLLLAEKQQFLAELQQQQAAEDRLLAAAEAEAGSMLQATKRQRMSPEVQDSAGHLLRVGSSGCSLGLVSGPEAGTYSSQDGQQQQQQQVSDPVCAASADSADPLPGAAASTAAGAEGGLDSLPGDFLNAGSGHLVMRHLLGLQQHHLERQQQQQQEQEPTATGLFSPLSPPAVDLPPLSSAAAGEPNGSSDDAHLRSMEQELPASSSSQLCNSSSLESLGRPAGGSSSNSSLELPASEAAEHQGWLKPQKQQLEPGCSQAQRGSSSRGAAVSVMAALTQGLMSQQTQVPRATAAAAAALQQEADDEWLKCCSSSEEQHEDGGRLFDGLQRQRQQHNRLHQQQQGGCYTSSCFFGSTGGGGDSSPCRLPGEAPDDAAGAEVAGLGDADGVVGGDLDDIIVSPPRKHALALGASGTLNDARAGGGGRLLQQSLRRGSSSSSRGGGGSQGSWLLSHLGDGSSGGSGAGRGSALQQTPPLSPLLQQQGTRRAKPGPGLTAGVRSFSRFRAQLLVPQAQEQQQQQQDEHQSWLQQGEDAPEGLIRDSAGLPVLGGIQPMCAQSGFQQQIQQLGHQAAAADHRRGCSTDGKAGIVAAAAAGADVGPAGDASSGSSDSGCDANDENACPIDGFHSIGHVKGFAKLAARTVKKIQQQQQPKVQEPAAACAFGRFSCGKSSNRAPLQPATAALNCSSATQQQQQQQQLKDARPPGLRRMHSSSSSSLLDLKSARAAAGFGVPLRARDVIPAEAPEWQEQEENQEPGISDADAGTAAASPAVKQPFKAPWLAAAGDAGKALAGMLWQPLLAPSLATAAATGQESVLGATQEDDEVQITAEVPALSGAPPQVPGSRGQGFGAFGAFACSSRVRKIGAAAAAAAGGRSRKKHGPMKAGKRLK